MPRFRVEVRRRKSPPEEALIMRVTVGSQAEAEWLAGQLTDEDSTARVTGEDSYGTHSPGQQEKS